MKAFKSILSLLLALFLLVSTLPVTVAADSPDNDDQSCTVNFFAVGNSEGSITADVDDVITLPLTVSIIPSDWSFYGWVDAELAGTTDKPTFYVPGTSYTVTADASLYALYTLVEEGTGDPVYKLVTDAPSDWSGNYVITNKETSSMYVLKCVAESTGGTDAENSGNCTSFESSGITLTDNVLYNVAADYVFTLEANGSYYTIQSASIGSYYGMNSSSYLYAYSDINDTYCNWTPAINSDHVVQLKNASNGSYPYFSFTTGNNFFWSSSSGNANVLRLWKEANGDTVYYTTNPATLCTITAVSNNTAWGTVSVSGYKITATPAAGYYLSGYEVTSGSATTTINDNKITVTPESDCTVTIIFAPIPTYTVTYMSASASAGSETAYNGDVIKLPTAVSNTPDGYRFSGWVETRFTETTERPVSYVPGDDYTVTRDATLYALFTRIEETGEGIILQLTDDLAVGGRYVIVSENYAVGNTICDSTYNCYINGHYVTTNDSDETISIPSSLDVSTVLYEIESGDAESGWVFKNVENGLYLTLSSDEYLIVGATPLAWLYKDHYLDNDVNSEGYYYLALSSNGPYFTTSKSEHYVMFYQEISTGATVYMTDQVIPMFAAHSLVLSGKIGVNFFMDLPAIDGVDYADSYMTFDISGKGSVSAVPVPFDSSRTDADGAYYGFTCYVNSIQMADTITATLHYGDGLTVSETYSIAQYIASFDAYAEANPGLFDAETIDLVHALADYGHYLQSFLSAARGWTIGDGDDQHDAMNEIYAESYDISAVKAAVQDYEISPSLCTDDIETMTYALLMDNDTAIYLYFKPVADYSGVFTVEGYSAEKQKDGRYLVKIPNIGAHKLDDKYTVVVTTTNGESTVTVSVLSYVYGILNSDVYKNDPTAQNAVAAIYYYHVAAQAYKTQHP